MAQAATQGFALGYDPPSPPIIATEAARAAEAEGLMVVSLNQELAGLEVENEVTNESADAAPASYGSDEDADWETMHLTAL